MARKKEFQVIFRVPRDEMWYVIVTAEDEAEARSIAESESSVDDFQYYGPGEPDFDKAKVDSVAPGY